MSTDEDARRARRAAEYDQRQRDLTARLVNLYGPVEPAEADTTKPLLCKGNANVQHTQTEELF